MVGSRAGPKWGERSEHGDDAGPLDAAAACAKAGLSPSPHSSPRPLGCRRPRDPPSPGPRRLCLRRRPADRGRRSLDRHRASRCGGRERRRRHLPYLRCADERHPRVLGRQHQGQATPPAGTFTAVSAGLYHTCGVRTNGTLACWGYNAYGQATPPPGTFTAVSAGNAHTCALRTNGTLACWGRNDFGQATPPPGTFTGGERRRPTTTAALGRTAPSPAGAPTTSASRRRPRAPSPR